MGKAPWDPEIQNLTKYQINWMASMMSKDKFDRMDEMIGLIEYLASYINPEGVKRVQEARKNTSFVPDDQFLNIIEKMSGAEAARDLAAKKDIK